MRSRTTRSGVTISSRIPSLETRGTNKRREIATPMRMESSTLMKTAAQAVTKTSTVSKRDARIA